MTSATLARKDAQEADALGANLDMVREWDRNGKLIYSRVGVARDLASGAVLPSDLESAGDVYSQERLADGRIARTLSRTVSERGHALGYVQVGQATEGIDRIVELLWGLGSGGLLLTLVIAVLAAGSWLARRSARSTGSLGPLSGSAPTISLGGSTCGFRDDELRRLAHAFDAMIARLDGAFERQRRFTADASHELRTPLGVIRSQFDVALSRPRTQEYYERVLASIRDETGRLTRLAESLLILARTDAGEELTLREIDYENLVAEAAASVAPSAREAQVFLSVQFDECPPILGDETWLTQLLLNLLENAIRHTPPGGRLTLTLSAARGGALVQVADTWRGHCTGAPAAPLRALLPGRCLALPGRRRGRVGQRICQWIARAHGGDLTIASTLGVGTTVSVWLPAADRRCDADRAVRHRAVTAQRTWAPSRLLHGDLADHALAVVVGQVADQNVRARRQIERLGFFVTSLEALKLADLLAEGAFVDCTLVRPTSCPWSLSVL